MFTVNPLRVVRANSVEKLFSWPKKCAVTAA